MTELPSREVVRLQHLQVVVTVASLAGVVFTGHGLGVNGLGTDPVGRTGTRQPDRFR